ncbi:hypothetical protein [Clostridium thermosuccinogenes]|jgi:hypothetical protein|nr:hypothetical protein [Pseudoclostridium thermosuccinogenes]
MFSFQRATYYFGPAILCLLHLGGLVVMPFLAHVFFEKFFYFSKKALDFN